MRKFNDTCSAIILAAAVLGSSYAFLQLCGPEALPALIRS